MSLPLQGCPSGHQSALKNALHGGHYLSKSPQAYNVAGANATPEALAVDLLDDARPYRSQSNRGSELKPARMLSDQCF